MKEYILKTVRILPIYIFFIFSLMNFLYADEKKKGLNTSERFWPQGGFFYQSHLGPTIVLGTAYSTLDYQTDGALYGPYIEAGLGTHGYSSDIGWVWGIGGAVWGASLSYVDVNDNESNLNKGNYYGLAIKGSAFLLSLRAGIYHETQLNNNKVSFSIGLGL